MTAALRTMAGLAAATLASEDLTCVGAGLLVRAGRIGMAAGIAGCAAGIAAGDLALWALGRLFGPRVLSWRWVTTRLPDRMLDRTGRWIGERLGTAVIASRFAPGSRVAFFLMAGATRQPALPVIGWTLLAAALWTPLLVGAAALAGETFASWFGSAALAAPPAALACLLALWLLRARASPSPWRPKLLAALARLRRWEYWPVWVLYLPLIPWIGLLALRSRGFATLAAANPAIPGGGFVGESKGEILAGLDSAAVLPFELLQPGEPGERADRLRDTMRARGWSWPIVLKPDAGQRGAGVRLIRDEAQAVAYLREHTATVLAQVYHPGPLEAGIFYYRIPGEPRGLIFSITDKVFPHVVGDGRRTLEDLVWAHPRHRIQARVYLRRLAAKARRVPASGERVRLAEAGNHCQGTMFRDGERLRTPALEVAIDAIARGFSGFHFGRFDVRYAFEEELMRGRGFAIVELNGVTSESTNIYDPTWSLPRAWVTLARQWALVFRIGRLNRARGAAGTPARELLGAAWRHRRHPSLGHLAD